MNIRRGGGDRGADNKLTEREEEKRVKGGKGINKWKGRRKGEQREKEVTEGMVIERRRIG